MSLLGGVALSGAHPEPTAKFFILFIFAWFCLGKLAGALLRKFSPSYSSLPHLKQTNLISYALELVMQTAALATLGPVLGDILRGRALSGAGAESTAIATTMIPSCYIFNMCLRYSIAPVSFVFHHVATVGLIVAYQTIVYDTGIVQPGTKIACLFLLEAITHQPRYVAMILYTYKHPWGPRLLLLDVAYQLLMKITTKSVCIVIWWGTWYAYGKKWFFLWGVYLPVSVALLLILQLWGNGYVQTLIALKALKKKAPPADTGSDATAMSASAGAGPRRASGDSAPGRVSGGTAPGRMSTGSTTSRGSPISVVRSVGGRVSATLSNTLSDVANTVDTSSLRGSVGLGELYVDDDYATEPPEAALAFGDRIDGTGDGEVSV